VDLVAPAPRRPRRGTRNVHGPPAQFLHVPRHAVQLVQVSELLAGEQLVRNWESGFSDYERYCADERGGYQGRIGEILRIAGFESVCGAQWGVLQKCMSFILGLGLRG